MLFFDSWVWGLIIMIIASLAIAKASNIFEVGADYLGRGMNSGVKGITLNAIGSSFPELLTTVFFLALATQENLGRDLSASIGANAGSAIFNSIVIPMLVMQVIIMSGTQTVNLSKKVILRDGLFLIMAEILLLIILSSSNIEYWHGLILASFYFIYITFALLTMSKGDNTAQVTELFSEKGKWYTNYLFKSSKLKTLRSWILLVISVSIIGIATIGLVEGCKLIADALSINPVFVALILVAAASSVPDTIISIKDAKKGNHNDALSNVLGSNIFDITISIGLPLAIYLMITGESISFADEGSTLIDIRVMLLIITAITILIYLLSKRITKFHVLALLLLYILFVLYSIGAAQYASGDITILSEIAGYFIEYLDNIGLNEKLHKILSIFIQ